MPSVRGLIIVALLGGALALAACGATGKDRSLSPAAYRTQLARLCVDSAQEASRIGGVQGANGSALADYFDKVAAVAAGRQKQFEALRPPADLRDEQSQLTRALVNAVDVIKQAAAGFRSGADPVGTYQRFTSSYNGTLRRQNALVKKLKVPKCEAQLGPSVIPKQGAS